MKQTMSKTEKEYFSRSVKKRLRAILNPELVKMCQILAEIY